MEMFKFAALMLMLPCVVESGRALLTLDEYTFPHIVDGSRPTLVKFDRKYAVDSNYNKLAVEIAESNSDMLVAEVEVDEQSEVELAQEKGFPHEGLSDELWNINLHNKYTAGRDLTLGPTFCFFAKGKNHGAIPKMFKGASKDLVKWLGNIGMRIGPKGTVAEMTEAIETLRGGGTVEAALWTATSKLDQLKDKDTEKHAKSYLQILDAIKKNGVEYASKERGRLMRLIESNDVSISKRNSLRPRLNILNEIVAALQDAQESTKSMEDGKPEL